METQSVSNDCDTVKLYFALSFSFVLLGKYVVLVKSCIFFNLGFEWLNWYHGGKGGYTGKCNVFCNDNAVKISFQFRH